jgi:lipopolysaccharide biosynthesis regulator YciM
MGDEKIVQVALSSRLAASGRDRMCSGEIRRERQGASRRPQEAPSDLKGRFLQGRLHLARRETTGAIQAFQGVLKPEPRLLPVRYQLALAQLQAGNLQQAKTELKDAISVSTPAERAGLQADPSRPTAARDAAWAIGLQPPPRSAAID